MKRNQKRPKGASRRIKKPWALAQGFLFFTTLIVGLGALAAGYFYLRPSVTAQSSPINVTGHIWSDQIGWISMAGASEVPGYTTLTPGSWSQTEQDEWDDGQATSNTTWTASPGDVQLSSVLIDPGQPIVAMRHYSGGYLGFYDSSGATLKACTNITGTMDNLVSGDFVGDARPEVIYRKNTGTGVYLKYVTLPNPISGSCVESFGGPTVLSTSTKVEGVIGGPGAFWSSAKVIPHLQVGGSCGGGANGIYMFDGLYSAGPVICGSGITGQIWAVGGIGNFDDDSYNEVVYYRSKAEGDVGLWLSAIDKMGQITDLYKLCGGSACSPSSSFAFGAVMNVDSDLAVEQIFVNGNGLGPVYGIDKDKKLTNLGSHYHTGSTSSFGSVGEFNSSRTGLEVISADTSRNLYQDQGVRIGSLRAIQAGWPDNYQGLPPTTQYQTPGVYTSATRNTGQLSTFNKLTYSTTLNSQTITATIQVSDDGNFVVPKDTLGPITLNNGSNIEYPIAPGALDPGQHVRVIFNLSTSNNSVTPFLHDFKLDYTYDVITPPVPFDYGVTVNEATGVFDGYAWSDKIGWIDFSPADAAAAPEDPKQAVTLNALDNQIDGWARACAVYQAGCSGALKGDNDLGDWYGWIKFGDTPGESWVGTDKMQARRYGDGNDNCVMRGAAWGGNILGWLALNSVDMAASPEYDWSVNIGTGCVGNLPPNAPASLGASITPALFCEATWPIQFSWSYDDPAPAPTAQSAYQVQVDDESGFNDPLVYDSGKVNSGANFASHVFNPIYGGALYWRVMVWDTGNPIMPSAWSATASFDIPGHALPEPEFDWLPKTILTGQTVQFTADLNIFDAASVNSEYDWTFVGGGPVPGGSGGQNPEVQYLSPGTNMTATLKAIDDAGQCSIVKDLGTGQTIPKFREIPPSEASGTNY